MKNYFYPTVFISKTSIRILISCCLIISGNSAWSQLVTVFSDDFSTNTNAAYTTSGAIGASAWSVLRLGADWGARRNTSPEQLELTNDVDATANVAGWVLASTPSSSFTAPYNTTLNANTGVVTWTFNMRQIRPDPAGFGAGSYGVAFILAGSATTNNNTGNGYAVVLGQSGATDPVRLARYANGVQGALSNIITSNTTGLTDFGTDYLSIKVTYTPTTNTWELFVRNDGATAFADPASGSLTSQGTAVDATHTGSVLALMGAWWQGSTAATQTAFFDNTTVTVCPFPTITLGTSPSVCSGITSTTLPYSATTNSPTQYSINFNPAAEAQGFEDVVLTALPGGSIPVVVPGDADPGVYNGVLTVQNDCGSTGTANFTVTISALGTASVGADQTTCVNGIVQVAGTVGGSSNAGTWSDGGAGGVFSNASGLATYYTPPFNNTDPITLTLTSNGPCPATDDLVVTYGPLPPLTLTAVGPANATCGEEIVITIEATNGFVDISSFQYSVNWDPTKFSYVSHSTDPIGGAPPGVGAFNTAGGILTSAWFDPSGSDGEDLADGTALLTITLKALVSSGTETVDITGNSTPIEATNSQFCVMTVNTANTQDITLNPIVVTCPGNQSVCSSALPLDLTTLGATPAGGVFSGTGVSGTDYNAAPGTTNTVTYTYTDGDGCSNSCTFDITIYTAPELTCPNNQAICVSDLPLDLSTLGALPLGGVFSGTGVSGTSYSDAGGTTNTVTYTVTDGNGCVYSCAFDITIFDLPEVNCPVNQTVCESDLPLDLTTLDTEPGGGTFSGTGVSGTSYSAAGGSTNTVTYSYTDGNGCSNFCTFDITVNAAVGVTCPGNQSVCEADLPLDLTALGATPGGGVFSGTGVSGTTYTAGAGTTNTVTYTYTDGNGCTGSCTFDITVNATPAVNCPVNQSVCTTALPLDLTALGATPGGGTFTGIGVSGTTYTAAAGTTNTVTYTYSDGNDCTNSCTFDITVYDQPAVDCPDNLSVCTDDLPLNLAALGANPGGGTFSGTGVSGTTYTATAGTTNTVTYTYIDGNGCSNSCTFDITVNALPAVNCPENQIVCEADLPLDLTALGASPGSGTFSGAGVSGTTYTALAGTTNTVTYTYVDGNGCSNSCTFDITVNATPVVDCPDNQSVCTTALPLDLTALGATPGGGTFSGTGVSGTTYTAAAGTTNTVTYTYTANGCTNSCTFDISVYTQPAVDCPTNQSVCTDDLPLDLTALGATPGSGTFSGTGVSGTTYTAGAGTTNTVTYTYTDGNGCSNSCTFDITVNALPAVNCPENQIVCEADLPLDLAALGATPGGGTFSGTGVSGTTYTAAAGTTNTVTYSYTDGNGCVNSCTFDITVNATPVVDCPDNQLVCTTALPLDLTALGATPGGGAFTGAGVSGTTYTAAAGTTNTVTYSYTANNCTNSCTFDITVYDQPAVNCPTNQSVCESDIPLDLTSLGAAPGGGTFTGTGVTGTTYTAAAGTTNTITYTYTDGNGCTNSCTFDITVNAIPSASINGTTTICAGGSTTLTATGGGTYNWSTNETTESINVSPATTTPYSVIVTNAGCSTTVSVTVTVGATETADAGDDQTTCVDGIVKLTGTVGGAASGGTWSDGGVGGSFLPDANTLVAFYQPPAAYTDPIILTLTTDGPCPASDNLTVTYGPLPALELTVTGPANATCGDEIMFLVKAASGYTNIGALQFSVNWDQTKLMYMGEVAASVGGGAPGIGGNTANGILTYSWNDPDPGLEFDGVDLADGTTLLTLTLKVISTGGDAVMVTGNTTPIEATNSQTCILTVNTTPANITLDPISITCPVNQSVCESALPLDLTALGATPGGGTFTGTGVSGTTYTAAAGTTNTVTYTYTDGNGCTNSCTFDISVYNQPSVTCPGDQSVCESALPLDLTALGALPGGGAFTGVGVSGTTYTAAAGTTNTVTYTYTDGNGCMNSCTFTITVNPLPTVNCPENQTVCTSALPLDLLSLGASPVDGTFTGTGVLGTTYSAAGGTTNTVTYTYTDGDNCTNSCTFDITVNATPAVFCPENQIICESDIPLDLTSLGAAPGGGTFTGTGVSGTTYTAAAGTTNTITYTYTDGNGCTNSCTFDITVNASTGVACPGDQYLCSSDLPLDLSLLGAAPGGGTFSGTGVSGTSYTAAGGTTNTVTYTYVNGDGCSSSCTFDVIVGATPTLTLTAEMPANATCGDLVDVTFKVSNAFTDISSLQFSVEWDETKLMYVSPATTLEIGGLGGDPIIGDLDALSNGELAFTWFDPDPNFEFDGVDLADGTVILTLSMKVIGSSGSAAVSITDNPASREVVNKDFCSNTVTAVNTSIALSPITVNCPEDLSVCASSLPLDLTSLGASPAGGTFSGTGVSGTDYTAAAGTTNTVTYTYTDINGCSNSCTFDITVYNQPAITCPGDQTVCESDLPLDLTALGALPGGGVFSGTGVSGTTYTAAGGTTNTVTYTITDGNGCTNSCTFDITVNALPAVNCPENQFVCVSALPLDLTTLGALPGGGTFSGTGVTGTNYTAASGTTNTITYTYTDGNNCSNSCTFDITVNAVPMVNCPENLTICVDNLPIDLTTLGALPGGGTFSGTGVTGTNYTAASGTTNTITYTYTDGNNCSNSCTFDITVNTISCCTDAIADAGDDQTVCFNTDAFLSGAINGGSNGTWDDGGAGGTFTPNANDLNATYTPPNNYSGDITLTLTPDAPGGTCTATSDALTLTVSPDQTLKLTAEGPAGPLTCGDLVSVTIKTTDFTDIGTLDFSVNWDAAELSLQGNTPLTIDGDAPVIGTPMANQLTFSWFDGDFAPYGADLADGTTILTLNFKVVSDMATGVNVDITGTPTALSASNSNFCEVTVTPMNMVEFDVQKISVTCPDDFAVCIEETPFALTDGIPGGGTFSGAGVTPPNMFDPATAGAGAHDITYTYTDANGCTNSCMFQITVNNQLVIDPIGNISVCPGAMVGAIPLAATPASNSTVFSWTGGASLGLVDGNDTGANPEIPAFMANAAITSATVTVTAVFGACMDDETFTVTLEDNEDPQITDCPDNQNLEGCNTDVITGLTYSEMDVTVTATQFAGAGGTASDNCGVALLAYKYKDSKSGACPITVSRVWTVTDLAGRTNQCTQTITIDDTQKPTITTCPQTRNIEGCNTDAITGPAYNESTTNSSYSVFSNATNGGVANDVCGIVSVTYKDSKSGTCPIVVLRTWTVTDACQNSTACVQTINVDDTQKPTITTCPQTRNIEGCNTGAITGPAYNESTTNSSYSVFSNATNGGVATDACGIVSVKYRDSKSGTCPIVVSRKWTVTDACDNSTDCIQTINVDDTQKPVITTCPQTRNIEGCNTDAITGPAYNESTTNSSYSVFSNATNGGVANDACGIVSVKYRDSKSGTCPIVVSRKWTVTDACDNSTDCIQIINVDDTELPDAYCQDATIVLGNDGTATLSPSDINDNSSDNCGIKNLSVSQSLFDCHHIGDNTVTLTVRDNCDNIATCQATVTVDQGNYLQMTPLPDISVCPATDVEAIELSGLPLNVVINYNWSGGAPAGMANGSATGADPEIPAFVATTNEGTWTVSVTANIFACVDEDEFTINVNDFNAPHFITCPADMIVNNDVDKCGANVNWLQPIAVDGCVDITEVGVYQVMPPGKESGSFFPIGMHTIKYVADDDNGNTTTCEFKVTVRDMQLPDIECPSGIQYLETNNGNCSHTLTGTYLNASVVENCGLDYVRNDYTNSPTLNGAVFPVGPWPIVVTWKAEDWSGNTATCTFAVIVVDNDAPTVASCPQDKTVSNDAGDCGAEVSYALPRFNDNCGGAYQPGTLIQGGSSGDFFNVGTTVVEWWYFDPSGNGPAVCNFTITVRDDEDPKITCPSNIVVEVDGSLSGGNGGAPSANPVLVGSGPCGVSLAYTAPVGTDNCAGVVTTLASGLGSGTNYYEYGGIYTETYNVVDNAGNSTWCSFTIRVKDPVDPTITCPSNTTVTTDIGECDAAVSYAFPYFGDNCPGYTLTQLSGPNSGQEFQVGTTGVSFVVTDDAGNSTTCSFTVTVEDRERPFINHCPNPVITVSSSNGTGDCTGEIPDMRGDLVSTDNCGVTGVTQSPAPGSDLGFTHGAMQTVTFVVTDAAGNTSSCQSKVTLKDDEKPSIDCNVNTDFYVTPPVCGHVVSGSDGTNPSFADNCQGAVRTHNYISAPNEHTLEGAILPVGNTTVVWTITDAGGNTRTCSVTYTITDNVKPVFVNCPSDVTLNNDVDKCGANVFWVAPVAHDDCGVTVVQTEGPAPGGFFPVGTTTVRYKATDPSGNTAICAWDVTIRDMQLPDIACPSGFQDFGTNLGNCSFTMGGTGLNATATDNCGVTSLKNDYNNTGTLQGAVFPTGNTKITWTARDAAGNTRICQYIVTVTDDDDPTVQECPSDIVRNNDIDICGAEVSYEVWFNDNCDGNHLTGELIEGLTPGSTFPVGVTTVVWRYVDAASNDFAECLFTVTVNDIQDPVIYCPTSIVVDINGNLTGGVGGVPAANPVLEASGPCGVTLSYTAPVGEDNCPNPLTVLQAGLGGALHYYSYGGLYVETYNVYDASGNVATCSFTIEVKDPITPTITCPSNTTVTTDAGECDAAVLYAYPYFGDNCPNYTLTQLSGPASGQEFQTGTTWVSFRVTDDAGNSTDCTFSVTVEDRERPFINHCPVPVYATTSSNGTGDCSGGVPNMTGDLVSTDNCGVVNVTQSPAAGTAFGYLHGAMQTVTFVVTDAAGNTKSCQSKVTLQDNEAPTINCSNATKNFTVTPPLCGHKVVAADNTHPQFSDNCDGAKRTHNFLMAPQDHTLEGAVLPVGTTVVVWKITDAAGNTATCSVTYTVTDNVPPVFENCPSDVTLNNDPGKCGAAVFWLDPVAEDDCGETVVQSGGLAPGSYFSINDSPHEIEYTAIDGNGNETTCTFTITIQDREKPDIECPLGLQYVETNEGCTHRVTGNYLDATVTDNCQGTITREHNYNLHYLDNTLYDAVFELGITKVNWLAWDGFGNTALCTVTVVVIDNDDPTVQECPEDITVSNDPGVCGAEVEYTVLFEDNCDGSDLEGYLVEGYLSGEVFPVGTTTVVWRYVDQASNDFAECLFTVTVNDTELPVITCPTDMTVNVDDLVVEGGDGGVPEAAPSVLSSGPCGVTLQYHPPVGTDNCPNPLTINTSGLGSGPNYYEYGGIYTEAYMVTDASGNTATCSFKITVQDPVQPTITCPANTTVNNDLGECDAVVTYSFPYFGDNCPNYTLTQNYGPNSGEEFVVGTTEVSFTVTDDAGNATTCTFTVTVEDKEKPVIEVCPADRFVATSSNGTGDCSGLVPNLVPEVVATDNCAVASIVQSPLAGTSFGSAHGDMIFVTITVTDIYGNTQTCEVKLTLTDDENPTIDCSQIPTALNNTPGYCHYFVPGFNLNPTYSDNCGPLVLTNDLTGNNTLGGTPLAVGSTTVVWTVTDAAGNTATCSVTYVVTDNEPPLARCQGPNIDVVLDGNGSAQLTVADVNNDSWDNCGPLTRTEISRGGDFGQFVYFTCDDIALTNGPLLVVLEVEDLHGNTDTCHTYVAVYDLESPVITCPNGIETVTDAGVCTAVVNGIALQYVHDNCPVTITYEITGATIKSGTGDASGTVFNKGVSTVTYTVVDESGNSAVCSFDVEVYDEENPIIDCTNIVNLVRSNNTDECSYTVVGTEFDPSFFSDNCPGATISNNYNNSASLGGAEFPVGLTIVIWTVTDASGNTVTCSSKVTINDTQLPTITCPTADATQFVNDADQCSKTMLSGALDPAFADNCPEAAISHNYVTAPNPWTLAGATFPVGSTPIVWTVTDASGNTATCSITVVVTDTQAPEFVNCPATMVMVGNDVDKCSAKVNWSIPVAEDNCDILSILQTGGPASGTIINVSPTPFTVTYTATDIHGNTATCTFQVQVVDTQNPEFDADITMPNDITVECNAIPDNCVWHGNGNQLICSPLTTDDVHDNCTAPGDLVITFTEESTQCANQAQCCFYNYTLTRTWKVTDAAGNMLVHTQVITVVDTTPPVAKCKNITVTLDKFGVATITGADINDGSTDNCAAPQYLTYTATPNTFGCNQLGPNNVTLTVTDPCGNSSTCTAVVTVVEGIGKCVPEYDEEHSVKCECLNNATTLDNGQFREVIQIWALAGQTWTLTANQGLYSPNSAAPPAGPTALPVGTQLVMGSADGLDNDGDGQVDEADEMVYYTLKGIHVEGIGYTVTVKNAAGQALTISNKCYYPTPIFLNLDDPFCLSTPPFVIEVGENYGASGAVTSITVNGVATNIFDAGALGVGTYKVTATFDAGAATPFITVNGQVVSGSDAAALADPGCQQMIMQFVSVVGTPAVVVCNDLLHISLDADCTEEILPDDVLEGSYFCYDDYKVELDKVPPYGNGPWVPAILTAADIGKTYAYRVVHLQGGNVCWGNVKIEDKLPPVVTCPADIAILCTKSEDDLTLTGEPTWEDCSAVNITHQDDYIQYTCSENALVHTRVLRTWVATDIWGNASSCLQVIDKLRGKTDQVTFPADVEYYCNALPASLEPPVTGWPNIGGTVITTNGSGSCGLSVSYTDEQAAVCPGSYKIIRTWKITDWCTGTTSPLSVTHVQYIKVLDAPPTIDFSNFTYDPDHDWYNLSANSQYNGVCIAAGPLPVAIIDGVCNEVVQVKITTPIGIVQNGGLIPAPGLGVGQHLVKYFVEDECGNITEKTITINVQDDVPPSVSCDQHTQVALGASGIALVNATTFDDGSYDNCCLDKFEARRMNGTCDGVTDDFGPTVEFCCTDINDTVLVVFRAYDCHGNYNDCMVSVFVEDKIKPTCNAPANVTVSCEAFDPSLWAYGTATSQDNCCLDTITESRNYNLFDTVCNRGTITRTFRAFDCAGNSTQCTQRVFVNYEQDYYIKFPNDVIVTKCNGTGNYGEPVFFGEDCELLGVSFEDEIFTVVPDACMKIERTWTIINWCTYNPNGSCVIVPNPNPNATTNSTQNLPGPIVSPLGTPSPWNPTIIAIAPGQPQTNYSIYYDANANCYKYKQIIKIIDTEKPVTTCPASPVEYCDLTTNDAQLWNQSYWWDAATESHDLCEGNAALTITATDSCSGAFLNISYLLFLDLDGNGSMETVVSSNNPPAPGTVNYNNLGTPNYGGGTPQVFDGRPVLPNEIYRWAMHQSVSGTVRTASVQWKTLPQMPTPNNGFGSPGIAPQLPYGTHKIKWTIADGCGNETYCEYTFVVKDCKAPTVVCHDGLSVNIMPTQMVVLWATDFLQYAEDNCTPTPKLKYAIRRAGQGSGFPVDALGNPITSVTFTCADLGEQEVELWAMDLAGNADYCVATVDVQDNNGNCVPGDKATVAGLLATELNDGVEEANVNLQAGAISLFDMSDDQGQYAFPNAVPFGMDYTVTPTKDDNPLNGVSTFDLVLISKHILGLEPLNSPYKMIAADANKSNSITTFDIVEIRKLILGIYNELPNNTSWRFVDKDFVFPQPANPFATQFPETKSVANVQSDQLNDDFVGVKIGDVNGTVIANALMNADDRTTSTLLFDVQDREVKAGETVEVTMTAAEATQGYQFTLNLNGLEVADIVESDAVKSSNFGVFADALTVSIDGAKDFTVRFRATRPGKLSQMLGVSSRITRAEAYGLTNDRREVALRFNAATGATIAGVGFELYQNQPNPFVNRTMIGFHLPEATEATLTVYDETGRMLYSQKGNYAKGYNAVSVERTVLAQSTGMLYYKLETATDAATKKMIQTK